MASMAGAGGVLSLPLVACDEEEEEDDELEKKDEKYRDSDGALAFKDVIISSILLAGRLRMAKGL